MKKRILLLAALFVAGSAGLAMGCGCSSAKVRLEPVREQIIAPTTCAIQQPVISHRTVYVPECSSCYWVPPSTSHPAYVIGNVLTAPFRWVTGRSLGQPDIVRSYDSVEPVGEKLTTITTMKTSHFNRCGDRLWTKKVTISDSMLAPVGERLTTVKVIRLKPMTMPVAENLTTCRSIDMQPVLQPVGEKTVIKTTKIYSQLPSCGCNF